MACWYDWGTIGSDMQTGIISSLLATAFTALMMISYRKCDNKLKYSKAAGAYLGYVTDEGQPRKLRPDPVSEAAIIYKNENRLRITLKHDAGKRTWIGIIILDNEHYGSVAWSYIDLPEDEVEFGFKRCFISSDYKTVMLVEEAPPKHEGEIRYGKEILIRRDAGIGSSLNCS